MDNKPTGKTYVGSDELYAEVQRTMQLAAYMNTGWRSEAEVRDYLRKITGRDIDDTVRVFTPLHINYGLHWWNHQHYGVDQRGLFFACRK